MKYLIRAAATGLVIGIVSMAVSGVTIAQAAEQRMAVLFDIGAQSLSSALTEFQRQARKSILFTPKLVANKKTVGVKGNLEPMAALSALLKDTGLQYSTTLSGAIVLSVVDSVGAVMQPVDQLRLAEKPAKDQGPAKEDQRIEEMVVEEIRERKPFADGNTDLPRTINDVKPYYIFDSKTIQQSGAPNIEQFLKERLTMNTVELTNSQRAASVLTNTSTIRDWGQLGNTSSVNLRGLGERKTLILIDGRAVAGKMVVKGGGTDTGLEEGQPDLNGIPMSAIDRIEVLPSSASAIYGGGAVGGVINVILKKNYSGFSVSGSYSVQSMDGWEGFGPLHTINASYGRNFRDGKTSLSMSASYSDAKPVYFKDQTHLVERYLGPATLEGFFANAPGATPNITIRTGRVLIPTNPNLYGVGTGGTRVPLPVSNLTLKGSGTDLGATYTFVPAGASAQMDPALLGSGLAENAGRYNTEFPNSNNRVNGLQNALGGSARVAFVSLNASHQLAEHVRFFSSFSASNNHSYISANPFGLSYTVPSFSPSNPFNQWVTIAFPSTAYNPVTSDSMALEAAAGFNIDLPKAWVAQIDYSRSSSEFKSRASAGDVDGSLVQYDLNTGVLDPFVDTVENPLNLEKYLRAGYERGAKGFANTISARMAGPVLRHAQGDSVLSLNINHRKSGAPGGFLTEDASYSTVVNDQLVEISQLQTIYRFPQSSSILASTAEIHIPIIQKRPFPLVRSLDFEVAGGIRYYTVTSGTPSGIVLPSGEIQYNNPKLPDGSPIRSKTTYSSKNNITYGFRYEPLRDVFIRISYAPAFLPPTYRQLLPNPERLQQLIYDPKNSDSPDDFYPVEIVIGGNPDLMPEQSYSLNMGAIWQPQEGLFKGMRLNLEYSDSEHHNQIIAPGAQYIINSEALHPDRVRRDPNTNLITQVDNSFLNLFNASNTSIDISVTYDKPTTFGDFAFGLHGTVNRRNARQNGPDWAEVDYVGWVNSGGMPEKKMSGTINWSSGRLGLGWSTTLIGSYRQSGVYPDPDKYAGPGQGVDGSGWDADELWYVNLQGSRNVSEQIYHNLYASYNFGNKNRDRILGAILDDVSVSFNITNVLDEYPAFDAYKGNNFYTSGFIPFRSYSISFSKGW